MVGYPGPWIPDIFYENSGMTAVGVVCDDVAGIFSAFRTIYASSSCSPRHSRAGGNPLLLGCPGLWIPNIFYENSGMTEIAL